VVAFEPNRQALNGIARHVQLNALAERVEIVPYAVGDTEGEATLYAAGASVEARLGSPAASFNGGALESRVKVVSLDGWCAQCACVPDWILIDVEGYEVAVLKGARELVTGFGRRPGIVVEMHPQFWRAAGTDRSEAEALFKELGIRPVPLTGQSDPMTEYGHVELAYD